MVHIYATNVATLPDPKVTVEILDKIPKTRHQKILKYVNEKDRKLSLGASLLLQEVLSKHNKKISEVQIKENGKPYIQGLHFNLSHSNDVAICAVGTKSLGCDIEKIRKAPVSVADRYFNDNEVLYLRNVIEQNKDSEFFSLWTIKESYIKMTGEGLSLPLNSFEVVMQNPIRIKRNDSTVNCRVKEFKLAEYSIAVCFEENTIDDQIQWLQLLQQ